MCVCVHVCGVVWCACVCVCVCVVCVHAIPVRVACANFKHTAINAQVLSLFYIVVVMFGTMHGKGNRFSFIMSHVWGLIINKWRGAIVWLHKTRE